MSTFLFVVSSLVQYGVGFHYSHINERMKDSRANGTSSAVILGDDHSLCTVSKKKMRAVTTKMSLDIDFLPFF